MSEKTYDSVIGRDENAILRDALDVFAVHCRQKANASLLANMPMARHLWIEKADEARALQAELRDIQH